MVLSCGSFGFFLNLIGIQCQIAQEHIMNDSLCHVLLSVKLIVWICSTYFLWTGQIMGAGGVDFYDLWCSGTSLVIGMQA